MHQDARAVARAGVGADGAAVREPVEELQALADDGVAAGPLDVRNKADAARIVFVGRVVEKTRLVHRYLVFTGTCGAPPRPVVRARLRGGTRAGRRPAPAAGRVG